MATDLLTTKVLSWYLMDESHLEGTGFCTDDDLTIDHVVPQQLGGPCCIYNFVLMKRSINSHFGKYYSKEKEALLGPTICAAAENVTKLIRRQGLERAEITHFDPMATPCPQPTRKRVGRMDQVEETDCDEEACDSQKDAKMPRWAPKTTKEVEVVAAVAVVVEEAAEAVAAAAPKVAAAAEVAVAAPPPSSQEAMLQIGRGQLSAAKDATKSVADTQGADWKQVMLNSIAEGKLPTFDIDGSPCVVKAFFNEFAEGIGGECLLFVNTPDMDKAIGVPTGQRSEAMRLLRQLVKLVNESNPGHISIREGVPTKRNGTKYAWFALSSSGWKALSDAARASSPQTLDSAVRKRGQQTSIDAAVQDEMNEAGLVQCYTCTMPVLDTKDPEFAQKKAAIERIATRGTKMTACSCGGH
jgi:hypothetical protein